jgi:predicted N-acetyltransferase YhbS
MIDEFGLLPDNPAFDAAVEHLYASAFGPGRHAKAAARLREGNGCLRDMSWVAVRGGDVIGACRMWPVRTDHGDPLVFLGPIAVADHARSLGLGGHLVCACIKACDELASLPIVLVGDLAFFAPFGFERIKEATLSLPAAVDPARLLVRGGPAPHGKLQVRRA